MATIETPRLVIISTPLKVIETRLQRDSFVANVQLSLQTPAGVSEEHWEVQFPTEWPGDAFALLPGWAERLRSSPGSEMLGGTMIERRERTAIGQMTLWPVEDGPATLEIGYGVNPAYEGRGYATEGVQALINWAVRSLGAQKIVASCLKNNPGSIRVLEKAGFSRIGERTDKEGELLLWAEDSETITKGRGTQP